MRRYIITLLVVAFLVGSLFKAADQTGIRILKMFGTIGIFLFGVVGTLALSRWQSREGLKEIDDALKLVEPEGIITDWAFRWDGRPDYLVVGPGGLVAVCLEDVAQSVGDRRAREKIVKARERANASVRWLRDRLNGAAPELKTPLGDLIQEIPVVAIVVLSRRRTVEAYAADGVAVLNAVQLSNYLRSTFRSTLLDERTRIRLTRLFRQV